MVARELGSDMGEGFFAEVCGCTQIVYLSNANV
jgi:hypothetical protein